MLITIGDGFTGRGVPTCSKGRGLANKPFAHSVIGHFGGSASPKQGCQEKLCGPGRNFLHAEGGGGIMSFFSKQQKMLQPLRHCKKLNLKTTLILSTVNSTL